MDPISVLTIVAAISMAAMGVYQARHPSKKPRLWVTILWVVVAGFVSYATYHQQMASDKKIEQLRADLTGEDSFAFFQIRQPVKGCEELFIDFVQIGGVEKVAIGWHKKDDNGKYVDLNTWGGRTYDLIGQTISQPHPIKCGSYKISFRSRNNNWDQFSELKEVSGLLSEEISLVRKERPIFPKPIRHFYITQEKQNGVR